MDIGSEWLGRTGAATAVPQGGWAVLEERGWEHEMIAAALAGSRGGHGRFVVLYGQGGIGRSSLLRAAVGDAEATGAVVLEACGSELERGYGFGVVRQLLEARIARLTAGERRSLLDHAGPASASALGIWPSEPRASGAGFEQIEAVYRLIGRMATETPLLVAIDDLQWCDRPSLDFICFLGHRARQLPVTIVAAWRRGEPGVKAGRLQALAAMPETFFLTPAPLGEDGVRSVLRRELGCEPSDEVVDAVCAQTGGQPFLVTELVAGLRLRGVSVEPGCRGAIETFTPESVRRNIAARLARLPESAHRLARAVSVLGDTSMAHAAALAGIDRDAARRATDMLVRAGVFRDDSAVAYAQPIVQRAVYDTLSSLERAEWHQEAAGLLCAAGAGLDVGDTARAAAHLLGCEPIGDARFAEVLCSAARHAAGEGALADARRLYERALGEIDEAPRRTEILIGLAELALLADDLPSAIACASEALALASEPAQRAAASVLCAQAMACDSEWRAAVDLLETEALALHAGHGDLELSLLATAATLEACAGAVPAAASFFADLSGETPAERAMLAAYASQMTLTGAAAAQVAELCGRALAGDAIRRDAAGFPGADYLACHAAVLADAGDLVEARLARPVPEGSPVPESAASDAALRAQLAFWRGELAQAAAAAHEALALLEGASPTALRRRIRADVLATLVLVETDRGEHEAAENALARLADLEGTSVPTRVCLDIARALARSEPTAELALEAEDVPAETVVLGGCPRSWAALAHAATGDDARAQAVAAEHLEFARRWGGPSVLGRALGVCGVVDAGANRIGFLAEAVAVLEDSPARLELARAAVELGAALRRTGHRRAARDELMRGSDLAHRCGADALAARARDELVATGARPRRAAFSGVGSLTAAERRVAMLAAAGMTNREIAKELTVSAKTVSGQLAAVYLKLDVHDRSALAAAMQAADEAGAEMEGVR